MVPIWYCNSQVESGLCVARARLCCGCVVIAGLCCSIFGPVLRCCCVLFAGFASFFGPQDCVWVLVFIVTALDVRVC